MHVLCPAGLRSYPGCRAGSCFKPSSRTTKNDPWGSFSCFKEAGEKEKQKCQINLGHVTKLWGPEHSEKLGVQVLSKLCTEIMEGKVSLSDLHARRDELIKDCFSHINDHGDPGRVVCCRIREVFAATHTNVPGALCD
jgi:hypothetical protein